MTDLSPETETLAAKVERIARMMRKLLADLPFCDPDIKDLEQAAAALRRSGVAQRPPHRIDDHMMRARRLVENHIEAFGMVPHPDLIKDAIADMSLQSFDLGFRAAGGSVSDTSTDRLQQERLPTHGNLLTEINKAAHAAGTNAWVRDVLKRAHRAIRLNAPLASPESSPNHKD